MKNSFKRIMTFVIAAAMILSLMVPAMAENGEYSETPLTYSASDYEFGKISHPNNGVKQADGIVDYTGNGSVAVTGSAEDADGQGDRGQSYAWSALAYGDYVYVGTCYAAMGNTLTAMDTLMGHDFDEETMRAELNAIFNGSFFYGQEDGDNSKGILVKVNVKTGEVKVIMANSVNGVAPLFRNAIEYNGKLYFCGSVNKNNTSGLPSVYEIDPTDDTFRAVYTGLSSGSEYYQAYKKGICTGIRGMAVYEGKLVISNVGLDGAYLLISDNPSEGFTKIATQEDLYDYPAIRYVDSVYGGGIWEIVEYEGSLYVAMCSGTPETRVGDNMRSFAIIRGDCSGDLNDPDAWTWTPIVGDTADGAKYTFGIDPERTRAAACNMCIYDGYLYIGEYNDEEIPLEELMFEQNFGFLARNLEQSVNLYRMSIGSDGTEQFELVVGEATEMFPDGGILCKKSGFGDYENQYFWQSKVFDGKLWLGTFDTSSLLEPLGQFTNGDLLKMSRSEWLSQINYIKVLFKLLLNNKNEETVGLLPSSLKEASAASLVDEAVTEANEDGTVSITNEQRSSLISGLMDGSFSAVYSLSTLTKLAKLNVLLAKLTDLVETNDISGFVEIYQKANDLYSGLRDKLPESLQEIYDVLVRVTELENMKDLIICLGKLSTAERGFGLYTITSENGNLSLETITTNGFGDPYNHGLRAFAANEEEGWMVIGTANPFMGTQLWRTVIENEDEIAAPVVTITTSSGHPKLYWDPVDGAAKYAIYRSTDGENYTYYTSTANTSWTNSRTEIGTTYYYKVKTVDADGTESEFSEAATMQCKPAAPTVKISRSNGKAKLTWSKVTGATKYWVYRSTDGKNYKYIYTTSGTSYTNKLAASGTKYYYRVKAVAVVSGKNVVSASSSTKSLMTTLAAPNVRITTLNGKPKISWSKVTGADKYYVYRSTDGKTFSYCDSTTKNLFTDSNAKKNTRYYYKVRAICVSDSHANSSQSSTVSIKTAK